MNKSEENITASVQYAPNRVGYGIWNFRTKFPKNESVVSFSEPPDLFCKESTCPNPLEKAKHGNRLFCCNKCHNKYNNTKNKEKHEKTKRLKNKQFFYWQQLNKFQSANKFIVTLDELKSAGVESENAIRTIKDKKTGERILCFIEYGLVMLDDDGNKFKIIPHGINI